MLHHISIAVTDIVTAVRFYDETLATLGYRRIMSFLPKAVAYGVDTPVFWVQLPGDGEFVRPGSGAHVAFDAKNPAAVKAFYDKALEMGGEDNGAPGPRPDYGPDYYGGFVFDPDGNRLEAVVMPMKPKAKRRTAKKAVKKAKAPARKAKRTPAKKASGRGRRPATRKSAARRAPARTRR
jgi:catechol 2,3-dioxygenase-like lactoylglutathione lyase family enzyme